MHRPRLIAAIALAATLALAGCSGTSSAATPAASPSASATAAYPRTVSVGDRDVTLTAQPTRIVPMSWEVSDLALELAGPERMAAVSDGSLSATSGNHVALAEQVATVLPYTTEPDPEQVLALAPDLVLLVARHPGEQTVADTLEQSGVPVVVFSDADFATPDALAASIVVLGRLFGTEQVAQDAADTLQDQVAEVTSAVADVSDRPRVLVLMARGPKVMEQSQDATLNVLVELAGGTAIAVEQGLDQTVPVDAEQILAANPDIILAEDFEGSGLGPFGSVLSSAALVTVPAVANQQIHAISTTIASSTSTTRTGEGLREIAELLQPEAF
ncbi:MAG: ABC transporter substrate-binding protein [Cellulomonas sp.]|nr:ABC transporter substrate-binding protein [Cellulomonas sp.]